MLKRETLAKAIGNSTVKGALVGGVSAALVTAMLTSTKPASASATVLLGPLATIQGMIDQYMTMMQEYAEQWVADLGGILDDEGLLNGNTQALGIYDAVEQSMREQSVHHAQGGGVYRDAMTQQLDLIREGGEIAADKAARYLTPPEPLEADAVTDANMATIWEHALLVTGDEPLPEVRESHRDTLAGTEYEYARIQAVQGRLLAQDAVQRYPLTGPKLEGYREHLEQLQSAGAMSGMTPGQIMAAQLDVAVKVQAASAIDQLESSLRQERVLGALLAQEVKPEVDQLRAEQP